MQKTDFLLISNKKSFWIFLSFIFHKLQVLSNYHFPCICWRIRHTCRGESKPERPGTPFR